MLSWICPECGRENDPAFELCPGCTPGATADPPPVPPAPRWDKLQAMPPSASFDMDYATAPYIDLATLGLPNHPLSSKPRMADRVSWHPQVHKADVPPPVPRSSEAPRVEPLPDSPAEDLAPNGETALALAERVECLLAPPVVRTSPNPALQEPLPLWHASPNDGFRVDLLPDHKLIRGIQLDLLRLLEALRESSAYPLLTNSNGASLLPATVAAPLPLARPRDLAYTLEYTPEPQTMAPVVLWKPVVRASDVPGVLHESPLAGLAWQNREVALPRTETAERAVPLFPSSERLVRLLSAPCRRRPPEWGTPEPAAIQKAAPQVRVPVALRGFHENGLIFRAFVSPAARKSSAPGWMISLLTALLILLASTWFLQKSAFADRFLTAHADAAAPLSDAALGAFPTMAKYVEVTGLRASVDSKNGSDIRYVVVNHSSADLPAFQIKVKVRPRKGNAEIFSFTDTVTGLGPNESREMHTRIPGELHSYELPEWSNLRVESHVTPKN